MLGRSILGYVWSTTRVAQLQICALVALIAPASMIPLELQRRMVDQAVSLHELWLLGALGAIYLVVLLVQGGMKYVLNVVKGRVLEEITRDLRKRVLARVWPPAGASPEDVALSMDPGTKVSILAAESEELGGFAAECLSVPLLQAGTILWILGYLIWVEPLVAALAVLIYAPQAILVPKMQHRINELARQRTRDVRALGREVAGGDTGLGADRQGRQTEAVRLIEQIFELRMKIYHRKYFLTALGNLLDALGPLVVLVVGGYLVIRGETEVSTLVVFISGFQKLSDPWNQLINFYRSISGARITFGLVGEAIEGTAEPIAERAA